MALPILAGLAARALGGAALKTATKSVAKRKAKSGKQLKASKDTPPSKVNRGSSQTKSDVGGASKATKSVRRERNSRSTKQELDSPKQTAAKVRRTKAKLAAEQSARRKAKDPSAARTRSQIKKDNSTRSKLGSPNG